MSSKAVHKSIMNGEKAFKKFFKKQSRFPRFKKKNKSDVKAYFPKNNKTDWEVERHRVKVPTLGWIRLKEKGYIPTNSNVKSGTISIKAGRYYISVLVEEHESNKPNEIYNNPIGIDLGVKEFAICSDGNKYKNINKTKEVKRLEKKLKREQRCLSRKYGNKKGVATKKNIQKQLLKVQRIHQRLANIRTDYINQVVSEIVKTKPSYITIEDLNIRSIIKNKHLSKQIISQKFYEFRTKLEAKCKENNIELRIVDRWYPSSKLCHECGCIKHDLNLSDRVYKCECGYEADHDFNASLNLRDVETYRIA